MAVSFRERIRKVSELDFRRGLILRKDKLYNLGLKDKNGKELMSNSKIKFDEHIGNIFYSMDDCRFKIKWEDGFVRNISKKFIEETEII